MIGDLISAGVTQAKATYNLSKLGKKGIEYLKENLETAAQRVQSKGTNGDPTIGQSANTSDQNIVPLYNSKSITNDNIEVIDADWVSSRFMVPDEDLDPLDRQNRYFSTTRWKYYDTTLGGHIAMNPRPQYTRYADIRQPKKFWGSTADEPHVTLEASSIGVSTDSPAKKEFGLGRFYSESIDDNATTVYLTFGRARFNSLLSYFTRAIDRRDVQVANTGRLPYDVAYKAGKVGGYVVMAIAFPAVSTMVFLAKLAFAFLGVGSTSLNFYYMEESMRDYWYCVNNLCTRLATEMGLVGAMFVDEGKAERIGAPVHYDIEDYNRLAEYMGEGIIDPVSGWIDVWAVVSRLQRVYNNIRQFEYDNYTDETKEALYGYIKDEWAKNNDNKDTSFPALVDRYLSFSDWKNGLNSSGAYAPDTADSVAVEVWAETTNEKGEKIKPDEKQAIVNMSQGKNVTADHKKHIASMEAKKDSDGFTSDSDFFYTEEKFLLDSEEKVDMEFVRTQSGDLNNKPDLKSTSWATKFASTIDSFTRDGALFAVFNVDYQGTVSESVSNSVSDMALKDGFKSIAKSARDINFNLAGGNILGEVQAKSMAMLKDFMTGAVEGLSLGLSNVVAGLFGGAYVDIPKKWDDSEISFPQVNYKVKLISPYGNPISQFMDIYIPLCMLLAGALPLAAGTRSYTSPFLCSIFNKGVQNIKLGMITQLSIERGTSNLGFSRGKQPLAVDVSFTVTDFSSVATSPMSSGVFSDLLNFTYDDDAPIQRYLNTLASRDIWTETYIVPKVKNVLRNKMKQLKELTSPYQWGGRLGDLYRIGIGPFVRKGDFASPAQINPVQYR